MFKDFSRSCVAPARHHLATTTSSQAPVKHIRTQLLMMAIPRGLTKNLWRRDARPLVGRLSATSTLSPPTAALQQVAAAIQQVSQRATLAQPQATQVPPPASGTPVSKLEGRQLDFHLGSLPLIEQKLTVSHPGCQAQDAAQEFVLVAPLDVDQVMDVYMEHGMLDSDPYWCRAWPSAIALASIILSRPDLVRGKRVADLGAGLGLAGLAAALAGAKEVVFLDREPLALQCGLLSVLATCGSRVQVQGLRTLDMDHITPLDTMHTNSASQRQSSHSNTSVSHVSPVGSNATTTYIANCYNSLATSADVHPQSYQFQGSGLQQYVKAAAQRRVDVRLLAADAEETEQRLPCVVRGQIFDWHAGPEPLLQDGGRFDVVMACDVLYEEDAVTPIAGLVPSILKSSGARLLLADPPTRTVKNRQRFVQLLSEAAGRVRGASMVLEECSVVDGCRTDALDPEMKGGLCAHTDVVPVQLMVFRSALGMDTVGIKV